MDILFGFDGGNYAELKSKIEITKVYIPNAVALLNILGHKTGSLKKDMIARVEYLYDDMKVKSLNTILQTYVKPIFLHALALFADVGGWLTTDDYEHPKPDLEALAKHDSVAQVVGYNDPRLRFRVRKSVEAYIECSKMGATHGHMQTSQFERSVQMAQQEASNAVLKASGLEARVNAQMSQFQTALAAVTPGGTAYPGFSPAFNTFNSPAFAGFPAFPGSSPHGPPSTPHAQQPQQPAQQPQQTGQQQPSGTQTAQQQVKQPGNKTAQKVRWGATATIPTAAGGGGGGPPVPPLQAAQQAVDGSQPRWMVGMNGMQTAGIRGLPKAFFVDYYDFQEKNPAISPMNPGSQRLIRRCAFFDIGAIAGYEAWKTCCAGPKCTFKHPGERVRGKDGRADITVGEFPALAMQNLLMRHGVAQKPK